MSAGAPAFSGLNSPVLFDARAVSYDGRRRQLLFSVGAQDELLVSAFVNVLKVIDPLSYTIKDLKCAASRSFSKHFRLPPAARTPVALGVGLAPAELAGCVPRRDAAYLASEARHHLCLRLEVLGRSSRCVLSYFFRAELAGDALGLALEESYAELGQRSFRLLDIFGLAAAHCVAAGAPLEACIVCAANNATVVIVPCRHLCICAECSLLFNQFADLSKRICPLCREPMTAFLRLKKLEGLGSAESLPPSPLSNSN